MTENELLSRIESSEGLRRVKADLVDEISFRADDSARFDPMTILMIISIIVQVISYCRKKHSDEDIADCIRNARTLPLRRTMLMRRRLKRLCDDKLCAAYGAEIEKPIYSSVVDMAENSTDAEIAEIIRLAREYAG